MHHFWSLALKCKVQCSQLHPRELVNETYVVLEGAALSRYEHGNHWWRRSDIQWRPTSTIYLSIIHNWNTWVFTRGLDELQDPINYSPLFAKHVLAFLKSSPHHGNKVIKVHKIIYICTKITSHFAIHLISPSMSLMSFSHVLHYTKPQWSPLKISHKPYH